MNTEDSLREYLRLYVRLPLVARARPAGPHVRLRGRRRARGQGDPDRRQGLLRGPRAPLRPGGRRRRGVRAHRRPARGAVGHQRPGPGRPGPRADPLDDRDPGRSGTRPAWSWSRRPRSCRWSRRWSCSTGSAPRCPVRRRGGGGQPRPAGAVHPRRRGGVRRALRAPAAVEALARQLAGATQGRAPRALAQDVSQVLEAAALAVALRRERAANLALLQERLAPGPARAGPGPRAVRPQPRQAGRHAGGRRARRGAGLMPCRPRRRASVPAVDARAAALGQGGGGHLRRRRRGQDHDRRGPGDHGRHPPRRAGAGAHRRPGPPPGRRARARWHRQRGAAGLARGVRRGRAEAEGRAVGGHARHQGLVGRPHPPSRARRRARATPSSPTRSTTTSPPGSCRATTTSPWSACTSSTPPAATT